MNTMEALGKANYLHQPLIPSLYPHRPSFSRPSSSLSFRTSPQPQSSPFSKSSTLSIRTSSSSSTPLSLSNIPLLNPENPKSQLFETLESFPISLIKTTFIAAVTATALFFARFHLKPAIAVPISPPPTVETTSNDTVSEEEREKTLEEYLQSHPDDVEALRSLMEIKTQNQKVQDAVRIIEQLIRLEPNDNEWPLLKAHMHVYIGELEVAKKLFNELLEKDPSFVEAYHGLVMAATQEDSSEELKEIEKKIEEAMKICKKTNKNDFRGFKLLLAQVRVIDGDYREALKIYQELVKDEPRDFRPYLCQGMIYTLLSKKDEAKRNFEKYRRLVPKNHPYGRYFDENVIATKLFGQKVENEAAKSKP